VRNADGHKRDVELKIDKKRQLAHLSEAPVFAGLTLIMLLLAGMFTVTNPNPAFAQSIDTIAKNALLIDLSTNTTLIDKLADQPMPPASMSKLMTLYMVFDRLKAGKLSLDDKFLVSRKAWRMGGSKMFVMVNKRVSVRDLLRGIIIQSGNDACIVIAEGIAGSEDAFAEAMNRKAKEIGLTNSQFKNATGWPAEGHYMSARDLIRLSTLIIRDFPEYYAIFKEKTFTFAGIKQGNRNPLLYSDFGADGLKTGHTEASGFGLTASAIRKGRRLVLVLNGLPSVRSRSSESARLLEWGFRETGSYALFKKDTLIEHADTWLGQEPKVPLVVEKDLTITMSRASRRKLEVKLIYSNPVPAPVQKGTAIGKLVISAPDMKTLEVPVVAGNAVERLGVMGRLGAAMNYLIWGQGGT
jgi:D-alanyl-D-alanine carboxypeptidase (penicillin-binding protein 5/6)